jgi:ABC-type nitrate/sulfonate/bicarbonate transport system substrate-binding protein
MTEHMYAPRQMTDHVWVVTTTDPNPSYGLTQTLTGTSRDPLTFRTREAAQDKADEINRLLNTIKQGEAKLDHGRKLAAALAANLSNQDNRDLINILIRTADIDTLISAFDELKNTKPGTQHHG